MPAHFIVRAEVKDAADRSSFDRWYQDEHLPQAVAAFKVKKAWRGWSDVDPSVHYAFYEFPDLASVKAIMGSAALKELVAEFDRVWGTRVTRVREVVETKQAMTG